MRDLNRLKVKYTFQLDSQQVLMIFVGLLCVCALVFSLGVMFGKRLGGLAEPQAPAVAEQQEAAVEAEPTPDPSGVDRLPKPAVEEPAPKPRSPADGASRHDAIHPRAHSGTGGSTGTRTPLQLRRPNRNRSPPRPRRNRPRLPLPNQVPHPQPTRQPPPRNRPHSTPCRSVPSVRKNRPRPSSRAFNLSTTVSLTLSIPKFPAKGRGIG